MPTVAQEISDILFDSLKIQAERYKTIMDSESLTHEQRKEFDTEIKQMYQLLSEMTQTSTAYTLAEIKALKIQYEAKILELQKTLDNLNVTVVKGENGKDGVDGKDGVNGLDGKSLTYDDLTLEQKQELKGSDGQNGLDGKDGLNGKSLTYDDLTTEQKQELKGANGLSAYEVALNNGFDGSETQWLDSLKSSSSSGGGSSLLLPIAITDVKDLQEWMTSYQNNVSSLQQSLNGGIIGSVNINQLNGNLNSLNGKIESVMNALFGIQQEDDETGLIITVQEGLFEKFEKLYNQVNPPVGG
jgi:hypothetical protein